MSRQAGRSVERPEAPGEPALCGGAFVSRYAEGRVDAAGRGAEEVALAGLFVASDELGGGVDPEEALGGAPRSHGLVDEDTQMLREVEGVLVELLAPKAKWLEEAIAGGETLFEEGRGDGVGLVDVGDVVDDAEEVAGIGVFGEGAGVCLALEDRDGVHDGVEGVEGDGVAEVVLGIVESEASEGAIETIPDEGVETERTAAPRALLLVETGL